ncbi:MAG: hypothetical protein ACE5FJ_01455 [Gemmatimonadales bacterium]
MGWAALLVGLAVCVRATTAYSRALKVGEVDLAGAAGNFDLLWLPSWVVMGWGGAKILQLSWSVAILALVLGLASAPLVKHHLYKRSGRA